VQEILKHVKNMDEEGILLASLGGGRDGEGDASEDAGSTGNKRKRKRIVLGESGLFRRWAGVLWDTGTGAGRFAKNMFLRGKGRLQSLGSFIR
ncbi:hypothetical protein QR510_28240, partial [Escherichia coli]